MAGERYIVASDYVGPGGFHAAVSRVVSEAQGIWGLMNDVTVHKPDFNGIRVTWQPAAEKRARFMPWRSPLVGQHYKPHAYDLACQRILRRTVR